MPPLFCVSLLFFIYLLSSSSNGLPQTESPKTGLGAILNCNSRMGKEGKIAIQMAMEDFFGHLNNGPSLYLRDSQGDPLQALSSAKDLIDKHEVRAIIGMERWEHASFIAELSDSSQVPILSLSNEIPTWAFEQWPFLVSAARSPHTQMKAVAAIVQSWRWRRVAVIYEEVITSVIGIFPYLVDALRETGSDIDTLLPLPPFTSPSSLKKNLEKLNSKQCRVFIVHTSLNLATNLFMEANKLGMMEKEYVWIVTDGITNQIDSLSLTLISSMQGVIGINSYLPHMGKAFQDFRSRFRSLFQSSYPNEGNLEPGTFALQAHDAVQALAQAMYGNLNRKAKRSPKDKVATASKNGKRLRDRILQSKFEGLSGEYYFIDGALPPGNIFHVANVVGKSCNELGYWTEGLGFSINTKKGSNYSKSMKIMSQVVWPGGPWTAPRGWTIPTSTSPLKIGVPARTTFNNFVNVVYDGADGEPNVYGFSVDVFRAALEFLPYHLQYKFVPHEGTYDSLVQKVHTGDFDAVVGDTAIVANRCEYVEFSQPYAEPGLKILVYVKPKRSERAWLFKKPFTTSMWISAGAINLYNGFVVWLIERRHNRDFGGTLWNQIGTMIWLTFTTLFTTQGDRLHSNLSRMIMVVWLFVALVITSSYTASLTSLLTIERLDSVNIDVETLKSTGAKVGCDANSFVVKYLQVVLGFEAKNIKKINSGEDYPQALRSGEIAAAFLEVPYVKVFLARYCNGFTSSSQTFKVGGFGFVFPRGSPVLPDLSEAVLKVSESGTLRVLENLLISSYNCSASEIDDDKDSLGLSSFWGLFVITGGMSTISLLLFILHRFWPFNDIRQERAQQQRLPQEQEEDQRQQEQQPQQHEQERPQQQQQQQTQEKKDRQQRQEQPQQEDRREQQLQLHEEEE